jgi:hypothetical protein
LKQVVEALAPGEPIIRAKAPISSRQRQSSHSVTINP